MLRSTRSTSPSAPITSTAAALSPSHSLPARSTNLILRPSSCRTRSRRGRARQGPNYGARSQVHCDLPVQ